MFEQDRVLAEALGAGGGDELGLHGVEHAFAQQPRDTSGKIKAQRRHRQYGVPRRSPQGHRQEPPFDGQKHHENRSDNQAGNANNQDGDETSEVVFPMATARRGKVTNGQTHTHREPKRQQAQAQRHRQPLGDDVSD